MICRTNCDQFNAQHFHQSPGHTCQETRVLVTNEVLWRAIMLNMPHEQLVCYLRGLCGSERHTINEIGYLTHYHQDVFVWARDWHVFDIHTYPAEGSGPQVDPFEEGSCILLSLFVDLTDMAPQNVGLHMICQSWAEEMLFQCQECLCHALVSPQHR